MDAQHQRKFFEQDHASQRIGDLAGALDFHRLANLLRAKAPFIGTMGCVAVACALIYLIWAPRIYESRAIIQVHQEADNVVNLDEVSKEKPESDDYLNTVVRAFESRKLMLRVIRSTGLDKDANFAPPRRDGSRYTEIELADRLSQMIKVSLRRGTRLVEVKVFNENPETAKMLVTALVTEFLREGFQQRRELSRLANEFLQQEAVELKANLETAERKLQDYKEKTKTVALEERQNITAEKLREVNSAATDARSLRLRLEADLEQIKTIDPSDTDGLLKIDSVTKIPQVALIREKLLEAENQLATSKARYLRRNPKDLAARATVENLKSELANVLSKAGDTLAREYQSALEAERKLDRSVQEQEQRALELSKIAIPYNVLQREVESDRTLFQSITRRLKETGITGGVESPAFRIIEEPLVAVSPVKPRKALVLGLSLVLGLALGVATVILMDAIDGSLRTLDEAESYVELPVLAAIPDSRKAELRRRASKRLGSVNGADSVQGDSEEPGTPRLLMLDDQASEYAEAFRTLRTSISLLASEHEIRSFLFTSAIPSEGKTFTAIHFASALASQGRRTLVIDSDLRESCLSKVLLNRYDDRAPGLTDLLCAEIPFAKVITHTALSNLFLLPAGPRVGDPAKLLDGRRFARILEHLNTDFDRIVIDSPPVNAVSDVLLIAALAQATCLVVRAGKTPKKAVLRALHQLEMANANVVGLVFNRLPLAGRSAGYYYYHYGSGYTGNGVGKGTGALTSSEPFGQ
jgi:polysaccharide biosynthesis transport protein